MEDAIDRFVEQDVSGLCVVDADGVLIGLLTRQNFAETMMIRSMRPDWRFHRPRASRVGAE